jgi:hypothetical protein
MSDVTEAKHQGKRDPWTDPDPQPEDFDEYLAEMRPEDWEHFPGNPDAKVNFIRDDEVEGLLGPDHPIVKWLKETGRVA